MRREWVMHLLMFTVSYAAFMGCSYFTKPNLAAAFTVMDMQKVVARTGSALMMPVLRSHTVVMSKPVPVAASNAPVISSARNEAVPMVPPAEVFVPDYSSPQAHLTSLERAAQFDDHAGNRLNAVTSLRQQAAAGDTDGSIAEALRAATMDEDPAVRNAAQSAYNEVMSMKQVR